MDKQLEILAEVSAKLHATQRIKWEDVYFNILHSRTRIKEVARARQWVGYMLYHHTGYTYEQVGEILNKHYSTIIYWNQCTDMDLRINKRAQYKLETLMAALSGKEVSIDNPYCIERLSRTILTDRDKEFLTKNANR
jgi:hypothetical protein